MPHLEITEVVLVHCKIVNSDYKHDSRVLYAFVPNKLFGQLLNTSSKNFVFSNYIFSLIQRFHTLMHGLLTKILNH